MPAISTFMRRKITLKTKLYPHQINSLKFHMSRRCSGDWSEMGVGKSLVALAKMRLLYNTGLISRSLIICPLSVIPTWENEIEKHTDFTYISLTGSLDQKLQKLQKDADIYIVSYDSLTGRGNTRGVLFTAIMHRKIHFVICDEVTHLKSANTQRTRIVTAICDRVGRTLFLSGTPITNNLLDVFAIYRAMDRGDTFPQNIHYARNMYFMNHGNRFPDWRIRQDKKDEFQRKLYKNCIRLLKSECLDLPEKIFTERYAFLAGDALDTYRKVAKSLYETLSVTNDKTININNVLTRMVKLSQITSGFLYADNGSFIEFKSQPKLDLLQDVLSEIDITKNKVVVFVKWRYDINNISVMLNSNNIQHVVMYGSTHNRGEVIDSFRKSNANVLICQIHVGAFGITLTEANHIVYYSFGFSLNEWLQSQDRIHRVGQEKSCIYIPLLIRGSIDEYIYNVLQTKNDIRKAFLDPITVERLKHNLSLVIRDDYGG